MMMMMMMMIIIIIHAWKLDIRVVSSEPLIEGGICSFIRGDINKQIIPTNVKKMRHFNIIFYIRK
jgi:hypothetical protein